MTENHQVTPTICTCPECRADQSVDYWKLGMTTACASCGHAYVPKTGYFIKQYGRSGVHINYDDFAGFIEDSDTSGKLAKIITSANMGITFNNVTNQFFDESNNLLTLESVHLLSQQNEEVRGDIYNFAMDLWHS